MVYASRSLSRFHRTYFRPAAKKTPAPSAIDGRNLWRLNAGVDPFCSAGLWDAFGNNYPVLFDNNPDICKLFLDSSLAIITLSIQH
jgi:hypothetical protein